MLRSLLFIVVSCFALCSHDARATTIYRCTDAKGAVTMQNDVPCGPGMKQEIRKIGEVPTAAPPPKRATVEAPHSLPPPGARFELVRGPVSEQLPEATLPVAERKPPPPLFECKTWESEVYLSDTAEPEARCAPLNTTGLDGNPSFGAGAACEVKRDTCAALEGEALCTAWSRRVDEARFRMTYAAPSEKTARKAEYDKRLADYVDSSCR